LFDRLSLGVGSWRLGVVVDESMTDFKAKVLATVRRIPVGKVSTYGDVAELAGRPGAARAVGNIMRDCKQRDVPCHRVIAAAGRLGGYGGATGLKRALLQAEGVVVRGERIRNFEDRRWAPRVRTFRRRGT
jgi:O-6-methylguanine DNA methyltransferase